MKIYNLKGDKMKTQSISNQNFNGQLVYLAKDGKKIVGEELRFHLPNVYRRSKKAIKDSLKEEPFDVFISRADNPLHFNIKASDGNKSTDNILVKLIKNKKYTEVDHYQNSNDIPSAIFKSISDFKNSTL